MQREKRLSKSSVAVIILAVLLVLSLVMGLTGAWFTDRKDLGDNTGTLTFGQVKIAATYADTDGNGRFDFHTSVAEETRMLPGDKIEVESITMTNIGDVNEYVYYKYDLTIRVPAGDNTEEYALEGLQIGHGFNGMSQETAGLENVFVRKLANNEALPAANEHVEELWVYAPNDTQTLPAYSITMNKHTPNIVFDNVNHKAYILDLGVEELALKTAWNAANALVVAADPTGDQVTQETKTARLINAWNGYFADYGEELVGAGYQLIDLSAAEFIIKVEFKVRAIQYGNLEGADLAGYLHNEWHASAELEESVFGNEYEYSAQPNATALNTALQGWLNAHPEGENVKHTHWVNRVYVADLEVGKL